MVVAGTKRRGNEGMAIAMTSFSAFGGFLYGYDTGYISGVKAMPYFLTLFGDATGNSAAPFVISSGTDSLITSILSAGTFVGSLCAFPVGDTLGRRWGIISFLVVFCAGVAMQCAATDVPLFAVGRVFAGLGVGGTSCLVPMYQSECAPKWIRGTIVSGYQWMITIGLLIAAVVVNGTKDINGGACYQIPIGLQFVWAAILGGGLAILPESPRWLIMKGKDEQAQRAISRILSAPLESPEVNEEFAEIAANLHHERAIGATSYLDCFRNGPGRNGLRMWTGLGIQSLQQFAGINFIIYYGTQFFERAGISNPFLITIAINVVNVGTTPFGMWAVDHFGRRPLLLAGSAGMCISQLIVAAVGVAIADSNLVGQKVLIAFVCIFIAFFATTWGPLAWVVTGEIYPTSIRARAMSMSTASNWLTNFAIGYATPYLVDAKPGSAGLETNVFWIWAAFCGIGFLFTFLVIPETKGLSLEQVDLLYRSGLKPAKMGAFRRQILSEDLHDEDKAAYVDQSKTPAQGDHKENTEMRDLAT